MYFTFFFAVLASFAVAQQTDFKAGTGIRSLWACATDEPEAIPYQTVSGTPLASILTNISDTSMGVATVYVISCPTDSPQCALAPNLTVTEGPSTARYVTANTDGAATLGCYFSNTDSATCVQARLGGGNIDKTTTTVGASGITYQAVDVTQTMNNTSTQPVTVTVAPSTTSTSSTSSSKAGAQTSSGPWMMGGAVGAGVLALAAL
ncbi:hypothetical protein LTR91_004673 [Friedmanniomyces endolithicus]|uniref:GPI anchored cell wall protein n=1 Tax=Friedmanniomyces endolithicus TaxID=329885 RepID=A0AAN6F5S2_9PEZI|nr:hypothetical protein LTR35_016607 [Friedmanniomyces endolithicus]KAK0273601.1 hypothetical protein LTS00_015724 [Friedmanniomyces endolithicus]KAK0305932.1 hypothetical protein LTR82_016574 [Friedmanniomyces endolithicus]KAK0315324.1 hypothetical protein LTR01_000621 [Friedmanniomyces endolithicus]KAK0827180.1 hypothetical protein LTR73_005964 [Friedmanniomyces endolithicus]